MWLGEGSRHLSPLGAQAGLADWVKNDESCLCVVLCDTQVGDST